MAKRIKITSLIDLIILSEASVILNWHIQYIAVHASPCVVPSGMYKILEILAMAMGQT